MTYRHGRRDRSNWLVLSAAVAACFLAGLATATPSNAASIPVWLDDAISEWNEKNTATPIEFLEIKDDFVWYTIPKTKEIGAKDVRGSIYEMVQEHGYRRLRSRHTKPKSAGLARGAGYRRAEQHDLGRRSWRRWAHGPKAVDAHQSGL